MLAASRSRLCLTCWAMRSNLFARGDCCASHRLAPNVLTRESMTLGTLGPYFSPHPLDRNEGSVAKVCFNAKIEGEGTQQKASRAVNNFSRSDFTSLSSCHWGSLLEGRSDSCRIVGICVIFGMFSPTNSNVVSRIAFCPNILGFAWLAVGYTPNGPRKRKISSIGRRLIANDLGETGSWRFLQKRNTLIPRNCYD